VPVHVSIHDVSPAWAREVDVALDLCHEAGIKPALLVVPDYHARAPLDQDEAYQERLRTLEAEGHEIYLHGYYHRARAWDEHADAVGASKRSLTGRVRHAFAQRVVSGGEAEFSDVSREEAVERLVRGERMLANAGLTIRGFVAPAWSMPRWVLDMLGDRGYGFTEDHLRVYDPANRTSRASVVLNFASRSPGRLFSTVAYCRAARPARRLLPARIAIHPADMRFNLLRSETVSLLAWAKDDVVARGTDLLS
jgi:uncharacterized protein